MHFWRSEQKESMRIWEEDLVWEIQSARTRRTVQYLHEYYDPIASQEGSEFKESFASGSDVPKMSDNLRMVFELPEYEAAYQDMMRRAVDGVRKDHPVVGDIRRMPARHDGKICYTDGTATHSTAATDSEVDLGLSLDDVKASNLTAHDVLIYDLGMAFAENMAKRLFADVRDLAEFSGNVIHTGGTWTIDVFLDAIETMHIEFDDDDEPILNYRWYVNPADAEKLAALEKEMTSEQRARQQAIYNKKLLEWKQRHTRRLQRS